MKAIPSLVATSTIGVAATGLVFGSSQQGNATTRPRSRKSNTQYDRTNVNDPRLQGDQREEQRYEEHTRPATSSTFYTQSYDTSSNTSFQYDGPIPKTSSPPPSSTNMLKQERRGPAIRRRRSITRNEVGSSDIIRKDSMSSRGSWYKRLSSLQLSQTDDSPRSSFGPESSTLNFPYASAASIASPPSTNINSQPLPNKLVKRTYSGRESKENGKSSRMPTLRRPATSHQRSITLHQRFMEQEQDLVNIAPRSVSTPESNHSQKEFDSTGTVFRHYFVPQNIPFTQSDDAVSKAPNRASCQHVPLPTALDPPFLMHARTILASGSLTEQDKRERSSMLLPFSMNSSISSHEAQASERPKRSLSRHLNRLTKGGGSRTTVPATDVSNFTDTQEDHASHRPYSPFSHISSYIATQNSLDGNHNGISRNTTRYDGNVNAPDVLHSITPSATADSYSSTASLSSGHRSPVSTTSTGLDMPALRVRKERSKSAVMPPTTTSSSNHANRVRSMTSGRILEPLSSESVTKGTASPEDVFDYSVENAFDSYKTTRTGSTRVRSPRLESLFDTSPISATDYSSTRTVSDYATQISYKDVTERIVEEDENMVTPKKQPRFVESTDFQTPTKYSYNNSHSLRSSPPNFSLATQKYGRLSFDDDEEDEDWTRDDEFADIEGSLSPPSTFNSTRINPALRLALASSTDNPTTTSDRPKSVFDWSEPSVKEKVDAFGGLLRPRTVHGKQAREGRGGRVVSRARPNALHVRSQSVPVVPLANDAVASKPKKFGTWGLGAKGVSEDWDNDFDFEICEDEGVDGTSQLGANMVVPEAIQASQASVVGHVGQIREVCLLVEDLKRLRGLAKEKEILDGKYATFWRQADGIIALAAPDEDEARLSSSQSPAITADAIYDLRESSCDSASDNDFRSSDSGSHYQSHSRRQSRLANASFRSRRSSAFSPDDNIFGIVPSIEDSDDDYTEHNRVAVDFARFVMEDIHQNRAVSDPQFVEAAAEIPDKMPFDTTSLRDLVARASALSRMLSDIIRKHDEVSYSPIHNSRRTQVYRHESAHRESSPAFVRVFTPENFAKPPLPRSQSHNAALSTSGSNSSFLSESPTRTLQQRMRLMTVI